MERSVLRGKRARRDGWPEDCGARKRVRQNCSAKKRALQDSGAQKRAWQNCSAKERIPEDRGHGGGEPENCSPEKERRAGKRSCCLPAYISIWGIMLLLNAVAWSSKRFCDWYLTHIYGIWVDTYGRIMGMIPFSVGEILIGLGACFTALGVLLGTAWAISGAISIAAAGAAGRGTTQATARETAQATAGETSKGTAQAAAQETAQATARETAQPTAQTTARETSKGTAQAAAGATIQATTQAAARETTQATAQAAQGKERKRNGRRSGCLLRPGRFRRLAKAYAASAMWILSGAFVLMTLNCYILYHTPGFAEKYLEEAASEYSLEELEALRNFVVEQCNSLCCRIPRNEDGSLTYQGHMAETARNAMAELGKTYGVLDGFYPLPKPLLSSDFMSQQHVAGCFYPFSMEANYNDVMYEMNMPSTMCHELAHLKGFIREDEANLIGYLACVQSEDLYFRYSGYLSVLYYVDNQFCKAAGYERYLAGTAILPQVHEDNIFLTKEERIRIERTALLDTETVDVVSDQVADARLKLHGVSEGMASYSGVVQLLLQYYDVQEDAFLSVKFP